MSGVLNGYNFTERVRKVLQMAREEAQRLRHEYVGTEHMLLGLIREGEGVAAKALENLQVDASAVVRGIVETVKTGKAAQQTGPDLPYTSRAKKVLELAMSAARELNHSYVGTEHLLLGLTREARGIAAQVLAAHGVSDERLTHEVVRLLGSESPRPDPAAGPVATAAPRRHERVWGGTAPDLSDAPLSYTILVERPDGRIEARRFTEVFEALQYLMGVAFVSLDPGIGDS